MLKSKLGIGPMSPEIIEAVFRYSHNNGKQLMLIASKNQIDHNRGYVNNWTTKEYMNFVKQLKGKYLNSDVIVCRDHCGPGFNGNYDLQDTYDTIKADIENGFDLVHIDFCHYQGLREEMLEESRKAIEYALSLNPDILLEIGTDENVGTQHERGDLGRLERDIDFFKGFSNPEFYVVETGSLIKETNQIGSFNRPFVEKISRLLRSKGLKLKEHNADYLSREEIESRRGLVNAMNIAPQLGVIQTALTLQKCLIYGVRFDDFLEEVYKVQRWEKWMHKNSPQNKFLCGLIAGHYHFSSNTYKKILGQLEKRKDIRETIIKETIEVIDHYERNSN